jgi:arginyl-tRNA synthetase
VIGVEQSLAQFQLRVALWILGHRKEALNYLHYPIGLVELEGQRMSARRGRYFTFDQVLDEADLRARAEVEKRSPDLPAEVKERVAERIAVSAVRYAMLSVESAKSTSFVWDKALSFETNSAPFINYAYTRGLGILRKIGKFTPPSGFSLLSTRAEQLLILQLSKFPETFAKAADELDPTLMCLYANELAQRFHEFYEKADISHLEDEELKRQRAALVVAVRTVLGTVADLLGLKLAHRM